MLPLGWRRGGPGRTGLLLSPIRSAMTQAPAPLRRGGNLARFTMGFSPAAPGDQERASQAMRLLPQPRPSGTRCGWGGARWGGAVMLSHQPLPLGVSVSCRSPAAQQRPPRPPLPFLASAVVGQRARAKVGQHHWSQRACPAPRPPRMALAEAEAVGPAPQRPV